MLNQLWLPSVKAPWVHLQSVGEPELLGWTSGVTQRKERTSHLGQFSITVRYVVRRHQTSRQLSTSFSNWYPKRNSSFPLPTFRHLTKSSTKYQKIWVQNQSMAVLGEEFWLRPVVKASAASTSDATGRWPEPNEARPSSREMILLKLVLWNSTHRPGAVPNAYCHIHHIRPKQAFLGVLLDIAFFGPMAT